MAIEIRWIGPSTRRRDGPENREFRRGRWHLATEEEVAYFTGAPNGWEMREVPEVEPNRVEDVDIEAPEAQVPDVVAPAEEPDLQANTTVPDLQTNTTVPDPQVNAIALEGSALEGEPEDEGFVKATELDGPRDEGFV